MIRVVGTVGEKTRQFRARVVAGADPDVRGAPRIADPDTNFSLPASGATKIDAYFEVPEGFEPQFVEYRRHARAPLTAANLQEEAFAALEPLKSEADREAERRIGREGFMGIVTMSRKEDRLPLRVAPQLAANSANVSGETLVSGRLSGSERQLEADRAAGSVQEFAAPEDMSVIQVRFRPYQARSLAGQVFNFVGSTLNQYYAEDTTGQRYPLRGYFATVRRGNERHVEIYYAGPPDSPEGAAFRGMLDFKYIEMRELRSAQSEAELGLVFLVPPGKQITKVVNQQGAGYDIRNIGT
jgi:hypothetical protein